MAHARPIVIIKKKVNHGGHHGGAWKVAYADFVTAMMALFIVLWLLNSSKQIREAVGGYFKDPTGTSKLVGSGKTGAGDNFTLTKDNMNKLKDELQKAVRKVTDFEKLKNQIEMTVTAEGLRIELMESEKGTFFDSGVAEPSADGRQILIMLAHELAKLPNTLSIEGHTDAKPFADKGSYSNWELSADRANSARRMMQENRRGPAPGHAGTRLCRSAPAQTERARRRFEPPYLSGRAVSGEAGSGRKAAEHESAASNSKEEVKPAGKLMRRARGFRHNRRVRAFGYRSQHLLLAHHQRGRIEAGHFEAVAVRDRVGRTSFHAIAAENAAVVVDVVDLGVALAAADAHLLRVLRGFNVNAVRRARRGAQKTRHALLHAVGVALQHVHAAVAFLEFGRRVGIVLGHRGRHHLLEGDPHALGDRRPPNPEFLRMYSPCDLFPFAWLPPGA